MLRSPNANVMHRQSGMKGLIHLLDEGIDMLLTITKITSLDEVLELSGAETTSWVGEFEWPEEVAHLFEVGADGVNLVNKIFHADNAVFSK
jgi:hypothetical protein